MNPPADVPTSICRTLTRIAVAVVSMILCYSLPAQNTTTLQASLTPTILINGPIGSTQQVQYSTNVANLNGWTTLSFVHLQTTPTPFYDATAPGDSRRFYRTVTVSMEDTNLVWIPSGSFMMGSPANEEGHQTNETQVLVTLSKGFFMGRYELRNLDWLATMNAFPVTVPAVETNLPNYLQRPVRNMFFSEATDYCAQRTAAELSEGKIPVGWAYRLPTEAEWEYACRAGSTTIFSRGNELRNDGIRQDANFDGHFPFPTNVVPVNPILLSLNDPVVVGGYPPNAFGLYDMHGNVEEWCLDSYPASTPSALPGGRDPLVNAGTFRIIRGGAFFVDHGEHCRSANRQTRLEFSSNSRRGFRVVLAPVLGP